MRTTTKFLAMSTLLSACMVGDALQSHGGNNKNIIGGTTDSGDPSVVQIRFNMIGANGSVSQAACTGTVVSPTVLLTAAHCTPAGSFGHQYNTALSMDPFDPKGTGWIDTAFAVANPDYTGDGRQGHDVGVVGLLAPTTIAPSALAAAPAVGTTVHAVGYGLTQVGTSGQSGTKYQKDFAITGVAAHELSAGPQDICHGDSGGPIFNPAGQIVGVASYVVPADCSGDDHWMRVDDNVDFLGQFLGGTGGGGGGGGGGVSNSCDVEVSVGGVSEEVVCDSNGGPYDCQCYVNNQLVKTCTSDAGCSIPGNCCGF